MRHILSAPRHGSVASYAVAAFFLLNLSCANYYLFGQPAGAPRDQAETEPDKSKRQISRSQCDHAQRLPSLHGA